MSLTEYSGQKNACKPWEMYPGTAHSRKPRTNNNIPTPNQKNAKKKKGKEKENTQKYPFTQNYTFVPSYGYHFFTTTGQDTFIDQ